VKKDDKRLEYNLDFENINARIVRSVESRSIVLELEEGDVTLTLTF